MNGIVHRLKAVMLMAVVLMGVNVVYGCGSKASMPDMSSMGAIKAVAREDGSGTRNEFYRIIGAGDGAGSTVASSTDDMYKTIAYDRNAIGYVAYNSIKNDKDIKVLSVDGKQPDNDAIRFNQYPLIRSYYMAYMGESDGLMQDFIRYVMTAGQDIVGKSCVAINSSSVFLSDKSSGKLRIGGSSSVAPIMQELIDDYKKYNPDAEINLYISDSSDGLNKTINGELDIALSSRELKDYENELLNSQAIGKDAIAVIVNVDNPVTSLTKAQLKKIYNGSTSTWQELR